MSATFLTVLSVQCSVHTSCFEGWDVRPARYWEQ